MELVPGNKATMKLVEATDPNEGVDAGESDISIINAQYYYHYTNQLSVCDVEAGGHRKPFDPI